MKIIKLICLMGLMSLFAAFTTPNSFNEGYQVGDKASDFKLKNVDGKFVSLSDYAEAKGFLVIFTCNSCPYANAYEDRIIELDKKYQKIGVPVVAINPNSPEVQPKDSFENMQKRAKAKDYTFPYLLDENQEVFPMYGAQRTPHCFLLEKTDGGYEVKYIGAIDDNYQDAEAVEVKYVENAIDAMLSGNEIEIKNTKAIGCSIKV
ncbi:thioredoxin family protein [Galbibacter mesophilus]|uniref:thioredoxin family protein n=1 Tax=Galbibacter mesophilus TaxID=379069 RepID=UPI001920376F|nr:thioredoxin family protein [Galbibacter mesophilus]MCM5661627.1 thioredoxin family protein [Galbibacter mesophilus]